MAGYLIVTHDVLTVFLVTKSKTGCVSHCLLMSNKATGRLYSPPPFLLPPPPSQSLALIFLH